MNEEVTKFLDDLNHPFREEIELLRLKILAANNELTESIKWNGPNYDLAGEDRITMRIHPPKKLQLIFHRGAKVKIQPAEKLIHDVFGLLDWKDNHRAVATFNNREDIEKSSAALAEVVHAWIKAAKIVDKHEQP